MKKKLFEAEVLSNEEIAPGIFRMSLLTEETAVSEAVPGQFVNLYPENGERLILPRPFGICDANMTECTIEIVYEVVGRGTAKLSLAGRGHIIRTGVPLGRGFDLSGLKELQIRDPRPFILAGGGVGIAPLLFLARTLRSDDLKVLAVLGFRDTPFLIRDFEKTGCRVLVTTERLNEKTFLGTVIDCMTINNISAPAYFACGPRGMLKAVDSYVSEDCGDEFLQVSMEERMGCGYGVCVGCSIPVLERDESGEILRTRRKVCKDGPVFRGSEVIWDDGIR